MHATDGASTAERVAHEVSPSRRAVRVRTSGVGRRACTERAIELVKYNFVDNPWEVDAEDARLTAVEPIKASD